MFNINLRETYENNVLKQKQEKLSQEAISRKKLADAIISALSKEELKKEIIEVISTEGRVTIEGFGCLCQGGFCSWQKGFTSYLTDLEAEWEQLGVELSYRIHGLQFSLIGKSFSTGPKLHIKNY